MTTAPTRTATSPSSAIVERRDDEPTRAHCWATLALRLMGVSRGSKGWGDAHERRGSAARPRRSTLVRPRLTPGSAARVMTAFRPVEWGTTPYYAPVW